MTSSSSNSPLDFQGENRQNFNFERFYESEQLIKAKFQGANLRNANLQSVILYGAEFQGANLRDANLQSAILCGAKFQGADLQDANLQFANLPESSFKGAKLHGAKLNECKGWESADWENAEYNRKTRFPRGFSPRNRNLILTSRRGQYATQNSREQSLSETDRKFQTALIELRKSIQKRQGQERFRQTLLEVYKGRCAITGCPIKGVLEAAHVKPYSISKDNSPTNGILLRADLHTLFDLNLIVIHPDSKKIEIKPSLLASEYYKKFSDMTLRAYKKIGRSPDEEYLKWRIENYEQYIGRDLQEEFL
ncbi:pentapeptide repeat-containing protein [Microcoleus sp. FACHB-SPT15]|uniref:pentapeptide repeat-containing protein n=1 Tax=Microcoleus sp. FACHB-SPT15 TaxID=2692830 RepID=UPI001780200F|nr:pentapeptide repeat-containing protein [Microcoleus sp. FACHB-SPT15]MBD1804035.1 pentapeptide repeat-containing protein [Microcoleus sp. FACHB-SPT15]